MRKYLSLSLSQLWTSVSTNLENLSEFSKITFSSFVVFIAISVIEGSDRIRNYQTIYNTSSNND